MKIKQIYIQGFGRLRDYKLSLAEDFTLLYGRNEAGKTTVLEFILSMLYGFPSSRLQNVRENHRVRYKPWTGGVFGGVLSLVHRDVEYEIQRSFGDRKAQDTIRMLRTTGGEEEPLGRREPGEYLLQMTRGEFLNSVFITQNESAVESDADILTKLMRTVSGTDREISAKEMEKALDQYRRELENTRARKPTLRSRALEEVEKLEEQLWEANEREERRLLLMRETEEAEDALAVLEKQYTRLLEKIENSKRGDERTRKTRLLGLWDRRDALKNAMEESGTRPLPGDKEVRELNNALRDWEESGVRAVSLREELPGEDPTDLQARVEALAEESAALATLEKQWDALMDENRLLLAAMEREKQEYEESCAAYSRRQAERSGLEKEYSDLKQRVVAEEQKWTRVRELSGRSKKQKGTNGLAMGAGLLFAVAGILLTVFRSKAVWIILAVAGLGLLLLARSRRKTVESSASDALLQELEQDLRFLKQALETKGAALAAYEIGEAPGSFLLTEEIAARQAEKEAQMRIWKQNAERWKITGPTDIADLRKERASLTGTLQERSDRITEMRARVRKAENTADEAAKKFVRISAPYFTADTVPEARHHMRAIDEKIREQGETLAEMERLTARIDEEGAGKTRDEIEDRVVELNQALENKDIPDAGEREALEKERVSLEKERNMARDRVTSGHTRLTESQKNPIIPASVEFSLQKAREKLVRIDEEIEAVDTALAVLSESLKEMQESFGPELNRVTAAHLAEMTLEEDVAVSVDRAFSVKITDPHTRSRWEQGYFSAGKVDQIYLALRMAIAEVVYRKENAEALPFVLDDALDQFDGVRGRRTLQKLMRSAETHGRQVLFATCHDRIRAMVLQEGGNVVEMERL